jgi:hypothetical protein
MSQVPARETCQADCRLMIVEFRLLMCACLAQGALSSSLQKSKIINHQSSIINHQSSIINHQSSIINPLRLSLG